MKKAQDVIKKKIKVDARSGCWNWTACVQANGYGRVRFEAKSMGAHRLSYLAFLGKIPKNMDVCHTCDNRKCVNPSHLFLGTRKENMVDAVAKGRVATRDCLPNSKIKSRDIVPIMKMVNAGMLYKDIGKIFGVSRQLIGKIAIKNGVRRNVK